MPGMRVFGRRCSIATDDFLFIGLIDAVIFLPWLAWIPVIYASYLTQRFSCDIEHSLLLIDVSLPTLCVLFFLNWLLGGLFVIFSVKGTISKPEPRRHVVTLVYIKLLVSLMDIACAVLGTVILVRDTYCEITGVALVIKVTTIFLWVATIVRIGMIIIFYDWNSTKNGKVRVQKEYFTAQVRTGTFKRWNLRLQTLFLWCTTPSDARKEALKTASELMALLSCDLDLVASDVIAGLLLYRQKCLKKWKAEKRAIRSAPRIANLSGEKLETFPPDDWPDWKNLYLASRYFNIGLGVFGWPWYVYRNVACGCCHLLKHITCCFPYRERSGIVYGDNCCGCNLAGLELTTGVLYEDLVHVSFVDRVFEVPFFVTYDHETKAILVVARGTMSVDDVLTDVAAGFAVMDDPGCPPGALCHHGMLNAARELKRKIEENKILEMAFKERENYQLVITGHSLGASVASILTILLKHSYPNVRGYAFAPAPTMNDAALPYTYDNVFTVVYGNDSVVYLNYENVKGMVIGMVKCLKECELPKYKVFLNYKRHHEISECDDENGTSENGSKVNGTDKKCDKDNCITIEDSDLENGSSMPCVTESLYAAGTILHIWKMEDGYRLKVTKAHDYKPLAFRPKMILNHFPQYVQACLDQIGKNPVLDVSSLSLPLK